MSRIPRNRSFELGFQRGAFFNDRARVKAGGPLIGAREGVALGGMDIRGQRDKNVAQAPSSFATRGLFGARVPSRSAVIPAVVSGNPESSIDGTRSPITASGMTLLRDAGEIAPSEIAPSWVVVEPPPSRVEIEKVIGTLNLGERVGLLSNMVHELLKFRTHGVDVSGISTEELKGLAREYSRGRVGAMAFFWASNSNYIINGTDDTIARRFGLIMQDVLNHERSQQAAVEAELARRGIAIEKPAVALPGFAEALQGYPMDPRLKGALTNYPNRGLTWEDRREIYQFIEGEKIRPVGDFYPFLSLMIGLYKMGVDHELTLFMKSMMPYFKSEPNLRRYLVSMFTGLIAGNGPKTRDHPYIFDDFGYYELLRELLDIPFAIITDGFKRVWFAGIPIKGDATTFDDVIKTAIERGGDKGRVRMIDIGTGHGYVPVYLKRKAEQLRPGVRAISFGTEIDGHVEAPVEHREALKAAGMAKIDVQDATSGRKETGIVLTDRPSRAGHFFDLVTWFKPEYMYTHARQSTATAAADIPNILANRGVLLIDFTIWEPPDLFLLLVMPIISFVERSRQKIKISLVELSTPIGEIDAKKTFEENIEQGRLLSPRWEASRKYRLLAEMGEADPEAGHLYLEPKTHFAHVLKRILRLERNNETDAERMSLLEEALRVFTAHQ